MTYQSSAKEDRNECSRHSYSSGESRGSLDCHWWREQVQPSVSLVREQNIARSELSSNLRVQLVHWEENNIYVSDIKIWCILLSLAAYLWLWHAKCTAHLALLECTCFVLRLSPTCGEKLEYFHPTENKHEGEEVLHCRVQSCCVPQWLKWALREWSGKKWRFL